MRRRNKRCMIGECDVFDSWKSANAGKEPLECITRATEEVQRCSTLECWRVVLCQFARAMDDARQNPPIFSVSLAKAFYP